MIDYDELYAALKVVYKNTGVIDKIAHSPYGVFLEARVFDVINEEQYEAAREYFKNQWHKQI